ncbi:MAG: sensor histidine kinase [Paracoccaceae bacterium]
MTAQPDHYLEAELRELMTQPQAFDLLDTTHMDGMWLADLDNPEHAYFSPRFWQALGFDPAEKQHLASEWQDQIDSGCLDLADAMAHQHIASPDCPFDQIVRYKKQSGDVVSVRVRAKALSTDGKNRRILGTHTIVGDYQQTDLDQPTAKLLEMSQDMIVTWTEETGIIRWNSGAAAVFDLPTAQATGRAAFEVLHVHTDTPWIEIRNQLSNGDDWTGTLIHKLPNGKALISNTRISSITLIDGRRKYLLVGRDVTKQTATIANNQLLFHELKHRVANLFGIVHAMVRSSSRGKPEVTAFAKELQDRVGALAAAHSASLDRMESTDKSVSMHRLVENILSRYPATGLALLCDSSDLDIPPRTVTPIGIILHEFATNAQKHGAWSQPKGKVCLEWLTHDMPDNTTELTLNWTEHGDFSAASENMTPGFGTKLIDSNVRQLGGTFTREVKGERFCNTLTFPL